ncbi:unnamed protein product [Urochloa humidicola]
MEEQEEPGDEKENSRVIKAVPLSCYDPVTEKIMAVQQAEDILQAMGGNANREIPDDCYRVHVDGGEQLFMNKSKWPRLMLSEEKEHNATETVDETREVEWSQESMGVIDGEVPDAEDIEDPVTVTQERGEQKTREAETEERREMTKQRSPKRKFYPTVAARKSSRGAPMTTSGVVGDMAGTSNSCFNPFMILNACEDEILEEIAINCDVVLGESREEISDTLNAMKLEEMARAELAEANYRRHLAEKLEQQHVLEGESIDLQVIDNQERGFTATNENMDHNEGGLEQQTEMERTKLVQKNKGGRKLSKGVMKGSRLSRELKRISIT